MNVYVVESPKHPATYPVTITLAVLVTLALCFCTFQYLDAAGATVMGMHSAQVEQKKYLPQERRLTYTKGWPYRTIAEQYILVSHVRDLQVEVPVSKEAYERTKVGDPLTLIEIKGCYTRSISFRVPNEQTR